MNQDNIDLVERRNALTDWSTNATQLGTSAASPPPYGGGGHTFRPLLRAVIKNLKSRQRGAA